MGKKHGGNDMPLANIKDIQFDQQGVIKTLDESIKESNFPSFEFALKPGENPQDIAKEIVAGERTKDIVHNLRNVPNPDYKPWSKNEGMPIEKVQFDEPKTFFSKAEGMPIEQVKFDSMGMEETPFKGRHPNIYALGKTLSDMIPYLQYIDPEERERFAKLSTDKQTRELLGENLDAILWLALPQYGKAVKSVVAPLVEKYLPKTFKALTTEVAGALKRKPKVIEREKLPEIPTAETAPPSIAEKPITKPIRKIKTPKFMQSEGSYKRISRSEGIEAEQLARKLNENDMEIIDIFSKDNNVVARITGSDEVIGRLSYTGLDVAKSEIMPSSYIVTASKKDIGEIISRFNVKPTLETLEPTVKGGMVGETPKYAEGSAINLERINTTNDIKQFTNNLTKQIEDKIGKHTKTWEQTEAEARALGWDIVDARKAWKKKGSFTTAEIDATRKININAITDLHETIKTLPVDRAQWTPAMRAKVLDAMEMVKTTSQVASEAGRQLNIHKRIISNDPNFKDIAQIQKVLKVLEGKGVKRTDDIMGKLKELSDAGWEPADVNRFIWNVTKTPWQKLSDLAYRLWMEGILSNPLTHAVNMSSNALTLSWSMLEKVGATGIESGRAFVTKTPRELFFKESARDIYSVTNGLNVGLSRFMNAMKKGEYFSKLDIPQSITLLPEKVTKFLPTRALIAEDAFFKGFIEHYEISRLAYRQARKLKLTGDAFKDKVIELTTNPTAEILEQAAQKAKYLTYQQELGNIGNLVIKIRNTIPGLKYFIPFVRTPTNIAKFALERTPLNFPRVISKAMKGELKGAEFSEELAKPLMGSLLAFGVYQLAASGKITGGGPKEKAARDALYNTGWLPYSYKTDEGTHLSFQRLEPMGSIAGMAADLYEIGKEMTEQEKYDVAAGISGSITKNISNKTFMQGFSNLINAISDPGRYGSNISKQLAGSVVPAVSAGVARSIDPTIRDTQTLLDTIKSRIPIVSKTLPAKLNVWGKPIERGGTTATRLISPMQISEAKGSPIEKEIVKLKINIGLPSRTLHGVELSQEDYWNFVKEAGQPAETILNRLVSSPAWERMDKEKTIRRVVDTFRESARRKLTVKLINEGKLVVKKK